MSVHSMSCAGNATNSEKFRKIKSLSGIFRHILWALRVASLKFFARDGNVVSSENCITIAGKKIALQAGVD